MYIIVIKLLYEVVPHIDVQFVLDSCMLFELLNPL